MGKFTQHWAADYDQRIMRLVPGYALIHEIASCVLAAELAGAPGDLDVLVAGAGTGRELDDLAVRNPRWRFTAVDPAQPMLDIAQRRATSGGYLDRVRFRAEEVGAYLPEAPHAAAVAILVAHFLPDDGRRKSFFEAVTKTLRPGAPLLLFDLDDPAHAFHAAYRLWAGAQGVNDDAVDTMFTRLAANFHPIGELRLATLLADVGCSKPQKFFQALGYCGYVTRRD